MSRIADFFANLRNHLYRVTVVAGARYNDDLLSLQAMSLTYTTLISLVPFLAVAFSVLTAFGVQNVIEPLLAQLLQPLGAEAAEITDRVIAFVGNIRVGVLGSIGVAMLFYTVMILVANIEDALNHIWRVPRSRSWPERFTAYLSVILVGPVLVFTALALTASAESYWLVERLYGVPWIGEFFTLITRVMPFVLLCGAFTFLYKLLPYTKVNLTSALVGGAAAAVLWQLTGIAFAAFVANSARFAAIYSSFAVVVVFLIWLYVGWLIVLIGAEVAYFYQHPYAFVAEALHGGKGHAFQEWLALSSLVEITRRYLSGAPPWRTMELAAFLGVPSLANLIEKFVRAGILLKAAEPEGVALARPPEKITVKRILDIVADADVGEITAGGPAAEVLARRDQAAEKALEDLTLRSLASSESQPKTLRFAHSQPR